MSLNFRLIKHDRIGYVSCGMTSIALSLASPNGKVDIGGNYMHF